MNEIPLSPRAFCIWNGITATLFLFDFICLTQPQKLPKELLAAGGPSVRKEAPIVPATRLHKCGTITGPIYIPALLSKKREAEKKTLSLTQSAWFPPSELHWKWVSACRPGDRCLRASLSVSWTSDAAAARKASTTRLLSAFWLF